jgi:hypothetical protein
VFPNFLVKNKSEESIKVTHTQCRLNRALAARGDYELYGLCGDPSVVLNTALVGTVRFNGEFFVDNFGQITISLQHRLRKREFI